MARTSFSIRRIMAVPLAYGMVFALIRTFGEPSRESSLWGTVGGTGLAGIVLAARDRDEFCTSIISIVGAFFGLILVFPGWSFCLDLGNAHGHRHLDLSLYSLPFLGLRTGILGFAIYRLLRPMNSVEQPSILMIGFAAMAWASIPLRLNSGRVIPDLIIGFLLWIVGFILLYPIRLFHSPGSTSRKTIDRAHGNVAPPFSQEPSP